MTLEQYIKDNLKQCMDSGWFKSELHATKYLTSMYNNYVYKEERALEQLSCSGEDVFTEENITPMSKYSKWLD